MSIGNILSADITGRKCKGNIFQDGSISKLTDEVLNILNTKKKKLSFELFIFFFNLFIHFLFVFVRCKIPTVWKSFSNFIDFIRVG